MIVGEIVRERPGGPFYRVTRVRAQGVRAATADGSTRWIDSDRVIRVATGAKKRSRAPSERPRAAAALATPPPSEPVTVEPRASYGASGVDPSDLF